MADPLDGYSASPMTLGTRGIPITPSDTVDIEPVAKAVVVTSVSAGNVLTVLPVGNDDTDWVPFEGVPVGFSPPYRVRRVGAATTCQVATVAG